MRGFVALLWAAFAWESADGHGLADVFHGFSAAFPYGTVGRSLADHFGWFEQRGNGKGSGGISAASSPRTGKALEDEEIRTMLEKGIAQKVGSYQKWATGRRAAPQETVSPTFMLRRSQAVRKRLEEKFLAVSTPGSKHYGRFLSREELSELAPPLEGSREAVLKFLRQHHVSEDAIQVGDDYVQATMSVEIAEAMFQTTFHHFLHRDHSGLESAVRATKAYSLPKEVEKGLYMVAGLAQLPALPAKARRLPTSAHQAPTAEPDEVAELEAEEYRFKFGHDCSKECTNSTTPGVLREAYQLPDIDYGENTSMSIAQFQGVSFIQADLDRFQKKCHLRDRIAPKHVTGFNDHDRCHNFLLQSVCVESLLDIEYSKAMIGDIPLYVESSTRYNLLDWANGVLAQASPPLIHSVSYGNDEAQQISEEYMDAANDAFMKFGLRGLSILFASGDQGVQGRLGFEYANKFSPDFPSGSPYVTSVGGTDFLKKSVIGEEQAWSASGGGFSNHFARPEWQEEHVQGYFDKIEQGIGNVTEVFLPNAEYWNREGRGYPDLSALGGVRNPYCVSTEVFNRPVFEGVGGTSASCPVVAGIFARLNAVRNTSSLPPMGFLNPFIYKHPEAFHDVRYGNNKERGPQGFFATEGWDPATGMGTPNFTALEIAALNWTALTGMEDEGGSTQYI